MTINVSDIVSSLLQPLTSYHMLKESVKFMCALFLAFSCCSTKCERLRSPRHLKKRSGNNSENPFSGIIVNILFNGEVMWHKKEKLLKKSVRQRSPSEVQHPEAEAFMCGFFKNIFWLIFCHAQLK